MGNLKQQTCSGSSSPPCSYAHRGPTLNTLAMASARPPTPVTTPYLALTSCSTTSQLHDLGTSATTMYVHALVTGALLKAEFTPATVSRCSPALLDHQAWDLDFTL